MEIEEEISIVETTKAEIEPEEPQEVVEAPQEEVYDSIPQTPQMEEFVPIRRTYSPAVREVPMRPAPIARTPVTTTRATATPTPTRRKKRVTQGGSSNLALKAMLLSIAGLSIAVALVGTGYADQYASRNEIQFSAIRFLGGAGLLEKTN